MAENVSYQNVQAEVMRRINDHVWEPGGLIPAESLLAKEFGCTRTTINRALRELADNGILDRKRKVGTRVALHPERKATFRIPLTRLEVENSGAIYRHSLIERKICKPPVVIRTRLGLSATSKMLHVRALHLSDGQPFQYEDRWVCLEVVPKILDAKLETISANEWLVQNAPFTSGDIIFSAASASKEEAELLGTHEGDALFVVERITWQGTAPVTQVRLAYAPGYRLHSVI